MNMARKKVKMSLSLIYGVKVDVNHLLVITLTVVKTSMKKGFVSMNGVDDGSGDGMTTGGSGQGGGTNSS
jgi:hypothetical protein